MRHTGYLLRTAFLRAATIAAREFGTDAHPRDAGVIATLQSSGPLSQQELALRLNVNRTMMVKLIDSLEARGLVERVRNPSDRRAYALHPTRAGLESMAEMLPRMDRAAAELTEHLTDAGARSAQRAAASADRPTAAGARRSSGLPALPCAPPVPRTRRRGPDAVRPPDPPLRGAHAAGGRRAVAARARGPAAGQRTGRGRDRRRARGARVGRAPARHRRPAAERAARHGRGPGRAQGGDDAPGGLVRGVDEADRCEWGRGTAEAAA